MAGTMKALFVGLLAVCCIVVGCTKAPPEPTRDAGADVATAESSAPVETDGRPRRASNPPPALPAIHDPRSDQEVARAACMGRCKGSLVKPLLTGATSSPIVPSSWTIPNWYIDFANSLGCASDQNSGTSATCSGGCSGSTCPSGVGPLLTAGEWLQHRLGTRSPTFAAPSHVVTLHVLSSQPSSSATGDPFGTFSPTSPDGMFAIVGTLQPVGSTFSAGTITQISRGNPGNDFQVGSISGSAVAGQLLFDSNVNSYAWIDSIATGTATCTQPIAAAGLTTPTNSPSFTIDGASWTIGDTLQLYTVPAIYIDVFSPNGGSLSAHGSAQTSGATWVQSINFADASGGVSNSVVTLAPTGIFTSTLTRADAAFNFAAYSTNQVGFAVARLGQVWLNGGFNGTVGGDLVVVAGAFSTGGVASASFGGGFINIQNDTIVHGGWTIYAGNLSAFNMHIPSGTLTVEPFSSVVMRAGTANGSICGASTIEPFQDAAVINRTGGTWTNNMLVNALRLTSNALTTGCAPIDGGTGSPPCGISLTSANIDTYTSLSDPASNARFTN